MLLIIVLAVAALGASIRYVNYTLYTAAVAAVVLIGLDLPHPTDFDAQIRRVMFTLAGLAIAIAVTLLANWYQHRAAPTANA